VVPSGRSVGLKIWCLDHVIIWCELSGMGFACVLSGGLGGGDKGEDVSLSGICELLEVGDEDTGVGMWSIGCEDEVFRCEDVERTRETAGYTC
jgi:hypothetical protein